MLKRKTRAFGWALGLAACGMPAAQADPISGVVNVGDGAAPRVIELESNTFSAVEAARGEKIQERYPDQSLRIERHVAQDADGNFLNHGPWTMWHENGELAGKGLYVDGRRQGTWIRRFTVEETQESFPTALQLGFEAPFASQADFDAGQLHGTWVVLDARKRQVTAAEFDHGRRHGKSISWRPDGKRFREIEYCDGEFDGLASEFDENEQLVKQEKFVAGYRHGVQVEYYDTGELKSECETLFAKEVVESHDDFWSGTTQVEVRGIVGRDQRHGKFTAWTRDGRTALEGQYADDLPDGRFVWWHENGNVAIEGSYVNGKQHGTWIWRYPNGLKEISGEYDHGVEKGRWQSWDEDGRLATITIVPPSDGRRGKAVASGSESSSEEPPIPRATDEDGFEPRPMPIVPARRVSLSDIFKPAPTAAADALRPAAATAIPTLKPAARPATAGDVETATDRSPALKPARR